MSLLALRGEHFRNLQSVDLVFSPQLNLVTGANGAGKTSLLELVYFLGRARSFRSADPHKIIQYGQERCWAKGRVMSDTGAPTTLLVERDRSGAKIVIADQPAASAAELVTWLPIRLVNPDSHWLLQGGPQYRRHFLDWGVFHVEPRFLAEWKRYARTLRQRNAALRAHARADQVRAWDPPLIESALALDNYRRAYIEKLVPAMKGMAGRLLGADDFALDYLPGWPARDAFAEVLAREYPGDAERAHTRSGPHRADFRVGLGGHAARDHVSRGQQKLLVVAMVLAQAQLFIESTGRSPLFLVDDLSSELDANSRAAVMQVLARLDAQILVTVLDGNAFGTGDWSDSRRFHMERGVISEVV